MKVLITGASGFVGLPIVEILADRGYRILAISRTKRPETLSDNVIWETADLSVSDSYQNSIKAFEPDVAIHLAWQGIPDFNLENSLVNLNASVALLSYVIGLGCCNKIIVSGSCFELNRTDGVCYESEIGSARDNFTWAKHSLLTWLTAECSKQNISLGWLRIFYAYGPRQRDGSLIPTILRSLHTGKLPDIRTPLNANDFVFIDDVAWGFVNAVEMEFPSGIYNLGSGCSVSVAEICRISEKIVCGTDTLYMELVSKNKLAIASVDFWSDCQNSKRFLNFKCNISLDEGLAKTWSTIKNLNALQAKQ